MDTSIPDNFLQNEIAQNSDSFDTYCDSVFKVFSPFIHGSEFMDRTLGILGRYLSTNYSNKWILSLFIDVILSCLILSTYFWNHGEKCQVERRGEETWIILRASCQIIFSSFYSIFLFCLFSLWFQVEKEWKCVMIQTEQNVVIKTILILLLLEPFYFVLLYSVQVTVSHFELSPNRDKYSEWMEIMTTKNGRFFLRNSTQSK